MAGPQLHLVGSITEAKMITATAITPQTRIHLKCALEIAADTTLCSVQ
jgi:hypothetical protein